MLVLTRKSEEQIIIGKGEKKVIITVLRVQGDKVSLGFEAAPDIPICRKEVFTKQEQLNESEEIRQPEMHTPLVSSAPCA